MMLMDDCIFCKIIKGEIPCSKVAEDNELFAFRDINPAAPTHILIVPKDHIPNLNELKSEQTVLIGKMHLLAKELAAKEGVAKSGYRVLFNCNSDAGQVIFHLHLHLIGGRRLGPMA